MNTLTETQVRLFASAQSWIEGEAVRQLYATAKLDGVRLAVGFPDLHPGKGSPVGAAFVTEGLIYPHLIGGDIGCGMALFKTDLIRRDAKLDRWAKLPFNIEHSWDQFVGGFLAEHDLESTEFDSALGTIGAADVDAAAGCWWLGNNLGQVRPFRFDALPVYAGGLRPLAYQDP